jgi:hypothetical protein
MGGHLLMSSKELKRKSVLELVKNKHITLREAARRMNLGYRQTLRVFARFCSDPFANFRTRLEQSDHLGAAAQHGSQLRLRVAARLMSLC